MCSSWRGNGGPKRALPVLLVPFQGHSVRLDKDVVKNEALVFVRVSVSEE